MPEQKTLVQQIQEHVENPELRQLLTNSPDFAPLLQNIENTYNSLQKDIKIIKQTLDYRTRAYNYSQKLLTKQNQEISHRANHDSLTGLPNRDYLFERLESSILQSQRHNTPFAILFIDLDGFKIINDNYGHDYGDQVLQKVAERLKTAIRETDTIARLSGDEFCILLMNVESPSHSARVARIVFREFKTPIQIQNQNFQIDMSIGISHFPEDGIKSNTLIKNADIAMYEAKQKGPNHLQFYEQRLTEQVTQRLEFERDLSVAVERKELHIRFQPQLQTDSGYIRGALASVFWEHPLRGQINSEHFYDIATDSQLLLPVFNWMLEQCCIQIQSWKKAGLPTISINIPVAQGQFLHQDFIKTIINTISCYPQAIKFIQLMVNENVVSTDRELALEQFKQIHKLELSTALVQCGGGLLPAGFFLESKIKSLYLDKNLIQDFAEKESSKQLLKGIIALAKNLQLTTHAPGVIKISQQVALEEMGCDQVSGNYFTKPLVIEDFQNILSRFKQTEAVEQDTDIQLIG